VLFVDKDYYLLLNNTKYLSLIYPLAQKLYPEMLSLHISSATLDAYVKNGFLEFENYELE
jgi:hypothetical protein